MIPKDVFKQRTKVSKGSRFCDSRPLTGNATHWPILLVQRGVRGHTTKPVSSLCVRKWSSVPSCLEVHHLPGLGLGDPDKEHWPWERADWKGFWTQPRCSKEVASQSHCHIDSLFFLVYNSWSSIWSFLAECHQPPHLAGKQKWAKSCPVLRSVDSQF